MDTVSQWILIAVFGLGPIVVSYLPKFPLGAGVKKFITYFSFLPVFFFSFGIFAFIFIVIEKSQRADWKSWFFALLLCAIHYKLLKHFKKL